MAGGLKRSQKPKGILSESVKEERGIEEPRVRLDDGGAMEMSSGMGL